MNRNDPLLPLVTVLVLLDAAVWITNLIALVA